MASPRFEVEEFDGVAVMTITDKKVLDEIDVQIVSNQLFKLVEEDGKDRLVIDFRNVEIISQALLGKLITLDKKVKKAKGKLRFCTIRPDIYEVFVITKLNKLFAIDNDLEEALQNI